MRSLEPTKTSHIRRIASWSEIGHAVLGLTLSLVGFTIPPPVSAASGPWVEHPQVRARLITPWTIAPPSPELQLGVEFRLAPDWHAYWKNPGDAGYPPEFKWSSAPLAATFQVQWPAPHRFILPGDLQSLGYADRVIYPVRAQFPADVPDGLIIEASVNYLVCADSCVPYQDRLQVRVDTDGDARTDNDVEPDLDRWLRRVPRRDVTDPLNPSVALSLKGAVMEVRVSRAIAATGTPQIFFTNHPIFDIGIPRRGSDSSFVIPIRRRDRTKPLPKTTSFEWTLTSSDADSAVRPIEGETVVDLGSYSRQERQQQPQ